ncbi:hypothetical protein ACFLXI_07235 [Chloroflexota bacterium]
MKTTSTLSSMFGSIFGTGPGAGMGLLMFFSGLTASVIGVSGYFIRPIRDAEDILPDHTQDALTEKRRSLDEILVARQTLLSQPRTTDRDQVLKDISKQLRSLGQSS